MPELSLHQTYHRIAMSPVTRRDAGLSGGPFALAQTLTLHDTLLSPGTGLGILEEIKAFAKGRYLLDKVADADERTAYLAVYLTAISAALRWHATSITSLPLVQLASALVWASQQDWLPVPTRRLCDPKRMIDTLALSIARRSQPE